MTHRSWEAKYIPPLPQASVAFVVGMVNTPGQQERGLRFLRSYYENTSTALVGEHRLFVVADGWAYHNQFLRTPVGVSLDNMTTSVTTEMKRLGSAKAHNTGLGIAAEHSYSGYLGILEDGIILTDGWLEPLIAALKEDPKRGWVSSLQRPNTRSRFMCCCSVMTREFYFTMVAGTRGMFFDEENFRTGPFDDSHAVWRARKLGFEPSGVAASVVEHPQGETTIKELFSPLAHRQNFEEKRAAFERLTGLADFDWDSMPVVGG